MGFPTKKRKLKGGLRWKQGADGCVFKPSVACQGDTTPNPSNTVSKIMPKGSVEERVQNFLQEKFPNVVAAKGVSIAVKRCTPQYTPQNENMSANIEKSGDPEIPPCFRLKFLRPEGYTNFVLEEYDDDLNNAAKTKSAEDIKGYLRNALNAAVALVPDDGPWVLGYDFHPGNIFLKKNGTEVVSSLADWGRTIIIENPKDPMSIQASIQQGLNDLRMEGWTTTKQGSYARQITVPIERIKDYPNVLQFPDFIRRSYDNVYNRPANAAGTLNPDLHNIRLTTVHGIINSLRGTNAFKGTNAINWLNRLIIKLDKTESQQDIVDAINEYTRSDYIDLAKMFPPLPAPAPAPTPAPASNLRLLGFGGKRTRKQKPKKRKHKYTR